MLANLLGVSTCRTTTCVEGGEEGEGVGGERERERDRERGREHLAPLRSLV